MSLHNFPGTRRGGSNADGTGFANGGGGGYDERMEARVAKLESTAEYIQRDIKELKEDVREIRKSMNVDFRLTWVGIIGATLGLAGILAKGFHWL